MSSHPDSLDVLLKHCFQGDEGFAGAVGEEGPKGFTVSLKICHKWAFLFIPQFSAGSKRSARSTRSSGSRRTQR